MHRIDSAGNVSGAFSGGTPGVSQATVISSAWLNDVQGELVTVIEGLGGVLVKGSNQLLARLNAKYGRVDLANTWATAQTFSGGVAGNTAFTGTVTASGVTNTGNGTVAGTFGVTGNTSLGGTLGVTGTTTLSGPANLNGTTTVNGAASATAGLTATNGTTNGNGVTATGNGTGSGVRAVGGASGVGVSASGGILGTSATIGASTLNYSPVYNYVNSAVSSTNANQHPLWSLQTSTGAGQVLGLTTLTKNTAAVTDWMNVDVGFSYDVGAEGSAVRGAGGQLWFSTSGLKVYRWLSNPSTAATPVPAMTLMNGHLAFDSAVPAPNSTVAVKNAVTPGNIIKAWVALTISTGNVVTVDSGMNVSSVNTTSSAGNITVNFAQAFADTKYGFAWGNLGTDDMILKCISRTTNSAVVAAIEFSLSGGSTVVLSNVTFGASPQRKVTLWFIGAQ